MNQSSEQIHKRKVRQASKGRKKTTEKENKVKQNSKKSRKVQ